jgi:MinD-like ATPase involved in chromosome partitioning or flagellar assembly
MVISFDETFDKVRECFQEDSIINSLVSKLEAVTIIRDVYGKIRLFLDLKDEIRQADVDTSLLEQFLSEKLRKYYGQDIWLSEGEKDGYKALIDTIKAERTFAFWDNSSSPRWYVLERHIAKQSWTARGRSALLPWSRDLVEQGHKPAIISFFSFKGGVGRTSSLVATALTLARNGHRVAIVDLDLEAPGLATIFSPDDVSNSGVIDYLLEKKIQEDDWILDTVSISDSDLLEDNGETINLFPAGMVDKNYLEKLARLDFQNLVDGKLEDRMHDMLKELNRGVRNLDFILLDARAGFHDIGGLAITNLSHGVVIFGTQSRQSWAGLTHVIRHLAPSGSNEVPSLILVHSMAPALGISGRENELRLFREKAYTTFQENYYLESDDVPNSNDMEEPFYPVVVPYQENLRGDIALFSRDSTDEESERLSDLVRIMTDAPYRNIAEKLSIAFDREFQKSNE